LNRLAEGLGFPRVDEDIERGECARQLIAMQHSREDGAREVLLEPRSLRSVTDDHQLDSR
jgi:hypothetical protein